MRWMKRLLAAFGILLLLLAVTAGVLLWRADQMLSRQWTVDVPALAPAGADLAEGARQAQIRGCTGCHAADLGGHVLGLTPIGALVPPNITRGEGGRTRDYTAADWDRAIRHGIAPGGRPLILMPSDDNANMSAADFAALVAYLDSVPPVTRELQPTQLSLLGRLLMGAGQLPLLAAERIHHDAAPAAAVAVAATAEYGAYVARICSGCHAPNLAGGKIPGTPPNFPAAADLTQGGRVGSWSAAEFAAVIRTGTRPDGTKIDNRFMPWAAFAAMTDTEIAALHLYLKGLPAVPRK